MRTPWPSGSCFSCPYPGRSPFTHFDTKHHLAATVHQHNPTPQSPHIQPVSLVRQVNSAYFTTISLPHPFFVNRKHAEMLYSKRFEIKDADLSSTGIPENVNLYVNPNFCPYYKWLWMKCRKIKREGGVKYLWSRDGKIKMKRDDNSNTIQVNHLSVLQQNFPNFDFNQF